MYFSKVVSSLCHEPVPSVERVGLFDTLGLFHHTSGHSYNQPLKGKGPSNCCFAANNIRASQLASRYRSRNAAHIVWEVIAQYQGTDGLPYVVLRNLI